MLNVKYEGSFSFYQKKRTTNDPFSPFKSFIIFLKISKVISNFQREYSYLNRTEKTLMRMREVVSNWTWTVYRAGTN